MKSLQTILTSFLLMLSVGNGLLAQSPQTAPTPKYLVLNKLANGVQRSIREGRRINVRLIDTKTRIKGHFSIKNDSTIQIADKTIVLSNIEQVKASRLGLKILGGVLALPGTYLVGIGSALIIKGLVTGNGLAVLVGVLVTPIGLIPAAIGIPLLLSGKRFDMEKWKVSIRNK